MAGYNGYSMSNNATSAYSDGEKPLSKFNKQDVAFTKELVRIHLGIEVNLTVKELKEFLKECGRSSWHHTSSKFNCTDFYDIVYSLTDGGESTYFVLDKDNKIEFNENVKECMLDNTNWNARDFIKKYSVKGE